MKNLLLTLPFLLSGTLFCQVTQVAMTLEDSNPYFEYSLSFPGFEEEATLYIDPYYSFGTSYPSNIFVITEGMELSGQMETYLDEFLVPISLAKANPYLTGTSPNSLPFGSARDSGYLYYDGAIRTDPYDFYDLPTIDCHCDFQGLSENYYICGGIYDWVCDFSTDNQTHLYFQVVLEGNWHSGYLELGASGSGIIDLDYSIGNAYFQATPGVMIASGQIPVECPSDLSGDGVTDVADFLAFNSAFGDICTGCPEDLNGDGVVDVEDFIQFNTFFNQPCD